MLQSVECFNLNLAGAFHSLGGATSQSSPSLFIICGTSAHRRVSLVFIVLFQHFHTSVYPSLPQHGDKVTNGMLPL